MNMYKLNTAEPLSQHDEKHVVPTPLSGIRVGKRRFKSILPSKYNIIRNTALISKIDLKTPKVLVKVSS
jgi:hypothetical protein